MRRGCLSSEDALSLAWVGAIDKRPVSVFGRVWVAGGQVCAGGEGV